MCKAKVIFFVFCLIQCVLIAEGFLKLKSNPCNRHNRQCVRQHQRAKASRVSASSFGRGSFAGGAFAGGVSYLSSDKILLFLTLIAGILFFLILLGIIKGLIGILCCPPVGMYGLELLVDLPRPLNRYQEKELRNEPVIYDVGGWPIHPQTYKRTVRILPKRTEFCLNVVFFLAYPFSAIVFLCAFCCCIRNYKGSSETGCFKKVNVIKVNDDDKGNTSVDVYNEEGRRTEEQDTRYVVDAMEKSKSTLGKDNHSKTSGSTGNK